jgi:serine/threonine protein kinase
VSDEKLRSDPLASTMASDQPAAHAAIAPGMRLGDRYRVLSPLGTGAMGAVWLATDEVLGEQFALKFVARDPLGMHALRDEVRLAQRVTHPNVCRTFDLVEAGGFAFVKMEHVAGESLAARLKHGRFAVEEAVKIARQIAAALGAAHARGVVHRDLKPANVMLDESGRVVVMDFGIARPAADASGEVSGTPAYMAPEQAKGLAVDGRADLYALGCVLHELLAGEPPFMGKDAIDTLLMQVEKAPPELRTLRPEVPAWLAQLVTRLLAKQPANRFADAAALAIAFDGPRRRRVLPAALALAAIAGAASLLIAHRPAPEWRPQLREHKPIFDENSDGPFFSPDGESLFYSSDREHTGMFRIYRAPVEGGAGQAVTPDDLDIPGGVVSLDGKSLFGFALAERRIYRFALDGGPPQQIAEHAARADVCGDQVAYSSAARVIAVRDGTQRELAHAEPGTYIRTVHCDASAHRLVYDAGPDRRAPHGPADLWLVELADDGNARAPARQLTHDASRQHREATFARDAHSVIYSAIAGGYVNLWELPLDGGAPLQRTFGEGPDVTPAESPDGKLLAYDVDLTTVPLLARSLGDGSVRRWTAEIEDLSDLRATRDGREVFAAAERHGGRRIVAVALDSAQERVVADGALPALSLDEREVLYVSTQKRVMAIARAGGEPRELTTMPGAVLSLQPLANEVRAFVGMGGELRSFRVPLAGGAAIAEGKTPWCDVAVASSGWQLAEICDGPRRFSRLFAPGAKLDPDVPAFETRVAAWDADGRSLVYTDGGSARRRFVDGRDEKLFQLFDSMGIAPSPDGKVIYYTTPQAHVRRQIITNWDARPRPWKK